MAIWEFSEELEDRRAILESEGMDAYCLQTRGGNEVDLANEINSTQKNVLVLPFTKITHQSKNGVKSTTLKVILPGYVFLFAPKDFSPLSIRHGVVSFSVVKNVEDGEYKLKRSDLRYANWVFNSGGIIGMSKAVKVDGKVRVVSGPLFNLTGNIKEYSRKNRNCRVEITLFNRIISLWLPFEWIEEVKEGE